MRLLLDTHALLWFLGGDARLAPAARAAITDPDQPLLFSVAGFWEVGIKSSLGKLTLPFSLEDLSDRILAENAIDWMEIEPRHIIAAAALPWHHRDPFDRMLADQCLAEQAGIISSDPVFDAYGVTRVW